MTRWPRGLSMQSPRRWAVAIATALPPDRPWPVLLVPGYGGGCGSLAGSPESCGASSGPVDRAHTNPMSRDAQRPAPRSAISEREAAARVREFVDDLVTRRTIRDFDHRPVPVGVLREAIRAAASAPSGANVQPSRFVVVTDATTKRTLREGAEAEEREFYTRRASPEWLDALAPLGTDCRKSFLEDAPAVIVVFEVHEGPNTPRPYYVKESVGIAGSCWPPCTGPAWPR